MKTLTFLILLAIAINVNAQQNIVASGGNASGSGGSASFTVGQVVYTTNMGASGSVAQGVQQPYEISVVTGLPEADGITLKYSVYPNPAKDFLVLSIEGELPSGYAASLYDMNSKLLKIQEVVSNETRIDMSNMAIATYFLKVASSKHVAPSIEIKTFKIIKN